MRYVTESETMHLRDTLARLDEAHRTEEWTQTMVQRKREEAEFHDWTHDLDTENPEELPGWEKEHPNMKFYAATVEAAQHREAWIARHAPGHIFVDYACGRGTLGLMAARAGAALSIGIDVSPLSVQTARRRAAQQGLEGNTCFLVTDCENTGFPDNSVDRVIAAGCLHHLDLSYALPELRRILKPGGRIYAIEALAHNPAIQLYRRMTPHLRTAFEVEHIVSLRDLQFARYFFDMQNVRYFHLFSIATTPLRKTRWFGGALRVANAIDRIVLKIPPISYMAWSVSFELVKKEAS